MDSVRGFTNGCFDLLHPGHIEFLQQCRSRCDYLTVAINTDESVQRLKGAGRPIEPFNIRKQRVRQTGYVDQVIPLYEDTPYRLIEHYLPDVIFKGGDYTPDEVVGADLARVVIIPLLVGWSTTQLIKRGLNV